MIRKADIPKLVIDCFDLETVIQQSILNEFRSIRSGKLSKLGFAKLQIKIFLFKKENSHQTNRH